MTISPQELPRYAVQHWESTFAQLQRD